MSPDNEEIARAFSGHRFAEAYPYLAQDVQWEMVGGANAIGKKAVVDVCEGTRRELTDVTIRFTRFRAVVAGDAVVVDTIVEYTGPGEASSVASCDLFDFHDGLVTTIRSFTVELPVR